MPDEGKFQNQTKPQNESKLIFGLCFLFLLLAVFAFHGKTIPYSNELVYLLRLEPNFLPNDWTFSHPADEHWLFNALFSLPFRFLSLETAGWLCRFAVWISCLLALFKIGKNWKIPLWAISVSIFVWLAFGQSIVGEEWIFGGFEAKTVAYVCLLFALERFAEGRLILPAALLGLTFSFHPAVGLWAILAVGLIWLYGKKFSVELFKLIAVTTVCALPGLIAVFSEQTVGSVNSFDDWRFIVTVRAPGGFDAFQFSKSGVFLLAVMFAFNFYALKNASGFALRFFLRFQICLAAFFLLGVILRAFEIYSLLRLMPMRLFPIFTGLFFLFTAFYFIPKLEIRRRKIIFTVFVIAAVALANPFDGSLGQIRETFETWTNQPDDLEKTFVWIAQNTPADAQIIAPPSRRDVWYFSRRATVASFYYPTYDRLSEWRARLADLTGNAPMTSGETANDEIETAFNQLSDAQIQTIKNKYAATHLVSRAVYPYPIIFETGTYKVYQLP